MKSVILSVVSLFSLYSCSQDIPARKVPSVVVNTVQARFANANKIEWEKKKALYEAEFKLDSIEYAVYVDAAGKLIMYKIAISEKELPAAVATTIASEYTGYKIDDVEKIEKDGIIYYEIELDGKGKKALEIVFSADGKLVTELDHLI